MNVKTRLQLSAESPYVVVKRVLDVALSSVLLLGISPLLLLASLAIKAEDRGSVLYVQDRLGRGGQPFKLLKLRSMRMGADKPGYGVRQDDERITKVGRILRRWSMDELPQLVNVVRGDMSLVGPRPALVGDLSRYRESDKERLMVRPGITGLAQVSGRATLSWQERIELDRVYVRSMSLKTDCSILLRSVKVVLGGSDIYPARDPWESDREAPK